MIKTIIELQKMLNNYEFILAGGSALTFQLEHRVSNNIDLFTNKTFFNTNILLKKISQQGFSYTVQQEDENSLILILQNIKTSFYYNPYPFIEESIIKHEIAMAHLLDIASMKIIEICRKGQKKDIIDLFFIIQKIPFEKIAQNIIKKYGAEKISPLTIGKALVYFTDADLDPDVLYCQEPHPAWEDTKKFFTKNSKAMVHQLHAALETLQ